MLFNSYIFWLFLGGVLALYKPLGAAGRKVLLVVASYVFYGFWDWRFLGLIFASTLSDYVVARMIESTDSQRRRKTYLIASLVMNLGVLGFFKYFGFFTESLSALLTSLGVSAPLNVMNIVLPVGISFYTFQTMSYTIDVYRRQTPATRNFLDFALYVSFFPNLVAGPIERSTTFLKQIVSPRKRTADDWQAGLYLVMFGLFKKVVIADNMAAIAGTVFGSDPASLTDFETLIGIYAFAFQIYGDFAGYSSIARGVGRWLGFDLMINFRMPYLAVNPSDFWRRWHISLSTWLREYLYIPLGGNRGGEVKTYRNLALTMILGGLWHGAAWTFVAWGAYQGLILIVYRVIERIKWPWSHPGTSGKPRRLAESKEVAPVPYGSLGIVAPSMVDMLRPLARLAKRLLPVIVMFHLACLGWVFFRAESMSQAFGLLGRLGSGLEVTPVAIGFLATLVFFVLPLMVYEFWVEKQGELDAIVKAPWPWRAVVYGYFVIMLIFFPSPTQHEFIYFQF